MRERRSHSDEYRVTENGKKPGVATELFGQVSDSLGAYYDEFGDLRGWVYMTTVDGKFMGIRFRPGVTPSEGVYKQDVRLHRPDGRVDLALTRSAIDNTTSVTGEFMPETSIGLNRARLPRADLTEYMEAAKAIMEAGLPLTSDDALARLQDKACFMIEGREASEYQKVVERMILSQGNIALGDKNAEQQVMNFMPIISGDEQQSVSSLTVVLSQGDVGTFIEDVQGRGRSIISTIGFSPDTFSVIGDEPLGGACLVSVQGVYDYEHSALLASRVRFVSSLLPTGIPPYERTKLFTAIKEQVVPERMICVTGNL